MYDKLCFITWELKSRNCHSVNVIGPLAGKNMSELAATEPDSGQHCLNSLPNELYNIDILLPVYEVLTFPEFAQLDLLFV